MNPNTHRLEKLSEARPPKKLSEEFSVGELVELEGREFKISYINDSKSRLVLEPTGVLIKKDE